MQLAVPVCGAPSDLVSNELDRHPDPCRRRRGPKVPGEQDRLRNIGSRERKQSAPIRAMCPAHLAVPARKVEHPLERQVGAAWSSPICAVGYHDPVSKTSVEIDRDIADRAAKILGTTTLRDTIHASLLEIVNAERRLELVALLREPGRFDFDAASTAWGADE